MQEKQRRMTGMGPTEMNSEGVMNKEIENMETDTRIEEQRTEIEIKDNKKRREEENEYGVGAGTSQNQEGLEVRRTSEEGATKEEGNLEAEEAITEAQAEEATGAEGVTKEV